MVGKGRSAIVLGTSDSEEVVNIGDYIVKELTQAQGWEAIGSSCADTDGRYRIPMGLRYEQADALVVSLGYTASVPWLEMDGIKEEDISEVINACLVLPLMAAKLYVEERWESALGGKVVFIGSYAHDHVLSHSTAYCAAKAGLAQAVRSLSWDLTPEGFMFYIVHPYHVPDTPMGEQVLNELIVNREMTLEQAQAYQKKDLRLPFHLTPTEVAEMVGWLLSPAPVTRWLSGQGLNLYGGVR